MAHLADLAKPLRMPLAQTQGAGGLIVLAAALAGFAVAAFAPQILNDGDTYWHIAAGNWMLDHGAVLTTDPFSTTMAGQAWHTQEWLSEILYALAYRLGGWSGVMLLTAAAAGLALSLLAHHLGRFLDFRVQAVIVVFAAANMAGSLLARPHLLALPLLVLWTAGLVSARSAGRAPARLLLPVMCLWANLHGGFMLGLALVLPFALEALLEADATARSGVARDWGLFFLGALCAALLTPHGLDGLTFPFQLMAMTHLTGIAEWQPLSFVRLTPFEATLIAFLYFTLSRGMTLPPLRILLLLGLVHMALAHARHLMVLAAVGPLILAEPWARRFPAAAMPKLAPKFVLAAALALALMTGLRSALPVSRGNGLTAPVTALTQLPPGLAQKPVLNDYAFGGYLIFHGIRPYIDSRADLYGDARLGAYGALMSPDPEAFAQAVRRYGIAWTLLRPDSPLAALLDRLPGWRRHYADGTAVIHIRDDGPPR